MGAGRIARRAFLGLAVAGGAGVAFGWYLYRRPHPNPIAGLLAEGEVAFNPYVRIAPDDTITIYAPRAEMGQGIETTLAALVCEELDVGLDQVRVEHGPPSPAYYNRALLAESAPFAHFDDSRLADVTRGAMGALGKVLALQITGASTSTIDAHERMRLAGAAARETLKAAAARVWATDRERLRTEAGAVLYPDRGLSLRYGALAETAAGMRPPGEIALRAPRDWRLLGRAQDDVSGRAKVTGAPIFGIDVELPDMLHATVRLAPRFGVRHARVDRARALAVPGVIAIEEVSTRYGHGFGVIAENTWAAFRGAEALDVAWEATPYPADDAGQAALFRAALEAEPEFSLGGTGAPGAAFAAAPPEEVLEAEYAVPFLAHAAMEPMNATAQRRPDGLTLWTGTQAPGLVQEACALQAGLAPEAVTVHVTHLGGGFGRRAEVDVALQAAALAEHTRGRPVKLTWTRETDIRSGVFRPAALGRFRARIVPGAAPEVLEMTVALQSVSRAAMGRLRPDTPRSGPDRTMLEGLFDQPYAFAASAFRAAPVELEVPVGFWRSVGYSHNSFFLESFLDEVADASGLDPLALRLGLMGEDPRFQPGRAVLIDATRRAGWGEALPDGRGRGLACVLSFGTWVAQVIEVDATGDAIRIERVWCSADPGRVIDPRTFEAQLVSGILFGLSQAMDQAITFAGGAVEQSNFDDYAMIRMAQAPRIEVSLLENAPRMGGAGEVGTPPAAPALANAIFAATGRRIRRLPLGREVRFA
jgi:isoquinoline 1-oxidoreductase subunit beta